MSLGVHVWRLLVVKLKQSARTLLLHSGRVAGGSSGGSIAIELVTQDVY